MEYMPCNHAMRGFVRRIEHLPINAMLPQHGSATKHQLEASNAQLLTIYRVASAINQTIDLQELFERIMQAMEAALEASQGRPMGIFLVDGERMRLAAHRGGSAEFIEAHMDMRVGD